jgi:hypothetical protein
VRLHLARLAHLQPPAEFPEDARTLAHRGHQICAMDPRSICAYWWWHRDLECRRKGIWTSSRSAADERCAAADARASKVSQADYPAPKSFPSLLTRDPHRCFLAGGPVRPDLYSDAYQWRWPDSSSIAGCHAVCAAAPFSIELYS